MIKYITELESIIIRCTIVLTMVPLAFYSNLPTQKCELCYEIKFNLKMTVFCWARLMITL